MTTIRPELIASTTRVYCRASHPDPEKARDTPCGSLLGDVPEGYHFVGISAQAPHNPNGSLWLRCPRRLCRTVNIFERDHGAG